MYIYHVCVCGGLFVVCNINKTQQLCMYVVCNCIHVHMHMRFFFVIEILHTYIHVSAGYNVTRYISSLYLSMHN